MNPIKRDNDALELIIKLGDQRHMQSLFEDGLLYMNTLEFYRSLESDGERSDPFEGAQRVRNWRGGILKAKSPNSGVHEEIAKLTKCRAVELNRNLQNLNVFCSYYLKSKLPLHSLGEAIPLQTKQGFGEYAVVIIDSAEFVTRVKMAALDKGYRHFRGVVRYEDFSQESIEVGPFVKSDVYSHQSELRIAVSTGKNNASPIELKIGSLRDIAILIPSSQLDDISVRDRE